MPDLQPIFDDLCALLRKHSKGLNLTPTVCGSQAKGPPKPALHLYGKHPVSVFNRPPQPMYLAGVILQKNFVSLHFLPIYGQPKSFTLSPALAKTKKGKACFNLKSLDPTLKKEISALLAQGKKAFQKLHWL